MIDFASISNNAVSELKKVKGDSLRFRAPTYIAISSNDTIKSSNLWLNLNDAKIAVVILPYSYIVLTAEDTSAFILFIDEEGYCSDSIDVNGWNLKFDIPKESLYRTYNRYATISKNGHAVTLRTPFGTLDTNDFKKIWKCFRLISTINEDYATLPLIKDLYDNELVIDSLKKENIRKEYERLSTEAYLKANQEFIEKLRQIINITE